MGFVKKIVTVVGIVVVLGALIPVLWPLIETANSNIQGMSGGSVTDILKAGFPIGLLVLGIAVVIGLIFYALRLFNVLGKR